MKKTIFSAGFFIAMILPAAPPAFPFPIEVRGGGEISFLPPIPEGKPLLDKTRYNTIIIGGGPAGLTAACFLSERGKKVLLIEKESALGGLASGDSMGNGTPFNRGVAYWASAYPEETKILEYIGLGAYKDLHAIPEPEDSYLWNGKLYLGLWEEETLKQLPASFILFKQELQTASDTGLVYDQPIEEAEHLELDALSAAEWIRQMPAKAAVRNGAAAKIIFEKFQKDPSSDKADPMADVIALMDIYCRSALGAATDKISALAFANFYISEISTRYTTPLGAGEATSLVEGLLRRRANLVTIRTGAAARRILQSQKGVEVLYISGGKAHKASADYAVFAAQLKFAPSIIEGLARQDPERAAAIAGMDYSHYLVHAVFVKGHPYRASYDTWTRPADYKGTDFTDLIVGRWMDRSIRGYEGLRDFKKDPPDENGILTIYHPYLHQQQNHAVTPEKEKEHVVQVARDAVDRLIKLYNPVLKENWNTSIDVRSVQTNRWPFSIHVAKPGHFSKFAKILRKPLGRIFFATNNIGTPSFEEALFRGHCAANNVLLRLDKDFTQESWSNCPLEP